MGQGEDQACEGAETVADSGAESNGLAQAMTPYKGLLSSVPTQ